jgi:uncharacterized membrane protein YhdT
MARRHMVLVAVITVVPLLLGLVAGCGQPIAKKGDSADPNLYAGGITSISKPGETPADWGYKKFSDPDAAMKEAGITFTLPNSGISGKFIAAYIGTNGMGQMGVSVWFEKLTLTCYKTDKSPIDYASWAVSMDKMSEKASTAGQRPIASATVVNGHNGMVWPHSENVADANSNGPVDLYWTDGSLSFQLFGKDATFSEVAAKNTASTLTGK